MANIETIAKEAGVSIATVSRTLRNPDSLKTANQRRTINIAKQLGYDFDKRKKRILSRKTKQIVFLSFSKTLSPESFYQEGTYLPIVNGINEVIEKEGYNLIVSDVGVDEKPPPSLLRNDIDGIIFHGVMSKNFYEKYIKPFPHVGVQHYNPAFKCNWVIADTWHESFQAVEHLYKLGHRNIAFITDSIESYLMREKYRGYKDALEYFNLPFKQELAVCWQRPRVDGIIPREQQLPDYSPQMSQLINSKTPPTAIICQGNFRVLATVKALEALNLSVPDDISIVGSYSEFSRTDITGSCSNLRYICSYASQFVMELINGQHAKTMKVMLQQSFYEGNSTKAINR